MEYILPHLSTGMRGSCGQHIYYYFNKRSKDGSLPSVWTSLLRDHHRHLDFSSAQSDGSYTTAKRGSEITGYQWRKPVKASHSPFLCDNSGQMLSMDSPQEGQHQDLYQIKEWFSAMCNLLEDTDISMNNVNPRNGETETTEYRYFDGKLYKRLTEQFQDIIDQE